MYRRLLRGLEKTQLINGLRTFSVSDGMQSSIKYKSLQVFFSPFQRKQQILEKQNGFPFLITVLPLWSQQSWVFLSKNCFGNVLLCLYQLLAAHSSGYILIRNNVKIRKPLSGGNSIKNDMTKRVFY